MTRIEERFSAALHNTARSWRQALARRLKGLGVGQAGWMAIAVIGKAAKPLSQTELAQHLAVEGPTVVTTIDRLVEAGLVSRVPSESDRRVKLVVLTKDGMRLYARVKTEAAAFRKQLLADIDKSELQRVTELLEALGAVAESAT